MRVAVVSGPAPGHVFPATALACALRDRGHDVLVLTGRPWLDPLRSREGLEAEELELLAPVRQDADFGYRLWGRAAEMTPPVARRLRSWRADVVVSDTLTIAGAWGAEQVGLPWVELVPHPLQDLSRGLPPSGTCLPPGRGHVGRARDALLRSRTAPAVELGRRQRAEARAPLGLPPDPEPRARLVATLPALEPPRPDWPAEAHVVGPLVWDPSDRELEPPPGDDPLVVLSASTALLGQVKDMLDVALAALAGQGVRLAATQFDPPTQVLPAWAVAGPGRQDPLLAQADVFLAGAGHGVVSKGLVHGVPLVMVPGWGEQAENATRIRRMRAGTLVWPHRFDATRLRRAVRRVLDDPSYASGARAAGATAEGLGPQVAASLVERAATGERVLTPVAVPGPPASP